MKCFRLIRHAFAQVAYAFVGAFLAILLLVKAASRAEERLERLRFTALATAISAKVEAKK
jgi:hypothetical protein